MDDDLAAAVDELVAAGVVTSRSDVVRRGLRHLVDRHRRDQIDNLQPIRRNFLTDGVGRLRLERRATICSLRALADC